MSVKDLEAPAASLDYHRDNKWPWPILRNPESRNDRYMRPCTTGERTYTDAGSPRAKRFTRGATVARHESMAPCSGVFLIPVTIGRLFDILARVHNLQTFYVLPIPTK
jgi:hypothetical protein